MFDFFESLFQPWIRMREWERIARRRATLLEEQRREIMRLQREVAELKGQVAWLDFIRVDSIEVEEREREWEEWKE